MSDRGMCSVCGDFLWSGIAHRCPGSRQGVDPAQVLAENIPLRASFRYWYAEYGGKTVPVLSQEDRQGILMQGESEVQIQLAKLYAQQRAAMAKNS